MRATCDAGGVAGDQGRGGGGSVSRQAWSAFRWPCRPSTPSTRRRHRCRPGLAWPEETRPCFLLNVSRETFGGRSGHRRVGPFLGRLTWPIGRLGHRDGAVPACRRGDAGAVTFRGITVRWHDCAGSLYGSPLPRTRRSVTFHVKHRYRRWPIPSEPVLRHGVDRTDYGGADHQGRVEALHRAAALVSRHRQRRYRSPPRRRQATVEAARRPMSEAGSESVFHVKQAGWVPGLVTGRAVRPPPSHRRSTGAAQGVSALP